MENLTAASEISNKTIQKIYKNEIILELDR